MKTFHPPKWSWASSLLWGLDFSTSIEILLIVSPNQAAARQNGCDKFFPQIVLNEVGEVGNTAIPSGDGFIDELALEIADAMMRPFYWLRNSETGESLSSLAKSPSRTGS
jgi:hypothetical protein